GLATFCLEKDALREEYDDLSDLNAVQMESVREWEMQFMGMRYDETDSSKDRHRKGRPRVTSAAEEKFIRVTSPNKCFTEFK
uniref:Uncharacterized protein n=1 Tax=Hucho hucho TaxID=62062 RepID=A0A4W5L1X9_9TELE